MQADLRPVFISIAWMQEATSIQ
jgi:hypothetical protein